MRLKGSGSDAWSVQRPAEVKKDESSRAVWKVRPQRVIAPYAKDKSLPIRFPSSGGHVKPAVNPGGPPPKAKYYSTTDSAKVA